MKRLVSCVVLAVAMAIACGAAQGAPEAPPAAAVQPKGPAPPPAKAAAPEPIPVPEIARRAEEVGKELRELEILRTPAVSHAMLEKRLAEIAERVRQHGEGTDRQLEGEPPAATLDGLMVQWRAIRAELTGDVSVLATQATQLENALQRLASLQARWTRTWGEARASRAPGAVLQRVESVLASIVETSRVLHAQRTNTLVLQDRLAREVTRCDQAVARIAAMQDRLPRRLVEPDRPPIWRPGEISQAVADLPQRFRDAVAADIDLLRQFARDQRWKFPIHAALFLGLVLVMRAARRRAHLWVSADAPTVRGPRVFDHSVPAALMVALLAYPFIYSPPIPSVVAGVTMVLALVPALRIMQGLLDPRFASGLYVVGAFFFADLIRHFAAVVPTLERPIFLVEMLAGIAALTWWWIAERRAAVRSLRAVTAGERLVQAARSVALLMFAAAFVAGAAGYMTLAVFLGSGILGNGYLALVLYTGVRVGEGLVAFALRVPPLRDLGMVRRRGFVIERRVQGVLRWAAIFSGLVFALVYFSLWNTAVGVARTVLVAEARLGSLAISLGDVLLFALAVWAAFVISAALRFLLEEDVYPRLRLERGLPQVFSSMLHYALLLAGLLFALAALGVDLTKITILAGALGVGIGFGLQGVVNNFVSGSLVLLERKINVGDAVDIGPVSGQVQQLGMRACIVRTWEGAEVIVPNANLISERVTNWTLSDRLRRVDVALGVAHGTSPERVRNVLLGVGRAHPGVLAKPAPAALFLEFGESALRFQLRVWTDNFDRSLEIQSELAVAVWEALERADIEIAVPQREVRLRPS